VSGRRLLGKGFWTSASGVLKKRWVMASPLIVFGAGLAVGWAVAPGRRSLEGHQWFSAFFGTSAQVIATLFVGYALGARFYMVGIGFATATLGFVALAEVAAVMALSPSLPIWLYGPLMGVTVGGGLGALVAALVSAARLLAAERADRERAEADKMASLSGGPPATAPTAPSAG